MVLRLLQQRRGDLLRAVRIDTETRVALDGVGHRAQRRDALPGCHALFVCFGNMCRSPLAVLILRRTAADAGVAVEVASAGTWAAVGQGMDAGTTACAERHGLEVTEHVARQMVPADVAAANIVVSLAADATPIVGCIASRLTQPPVILDRPALNPWGMADDAHEHAYAQTAATCAEVLARTQA